MQAVTGAVELRTRDAGEIERFTREHLESLDSHVLTIRIGKDGDYIAEFYSTDEPTS